MVDLEELSNNLQSWFEGSSYIILQSGFLEDIAFFNAERGKASYDIIITSNVDDDIISAEESEEILELFTLKKPKLIIDSFFNKYNFIVQKSRIFVENYEFQ